MSIKRRIILFERRKNKYLVKETNRSHTYLKNQSPDVGKDLCNGFRMSSTNAEKIDKSSLGQRRLQPLNKLIRHQGNSLNQ